MSKNSTLETSKHDSVSIQQEFRRFAEKTHSTSIDDYVNFAKYLVVSIF